MRTPEVEMVRRDGYWIGRFNAMASPCELLLEEPSRLRAERLTRVVAHEALRIERKFSRYRDDNVLARINCAGGKTLEVDSETANLLDYADDCYRLSEGLFDITSGVLRRAWRFDGSDNLPSRRAVEELMPYVGWQRVRWERPCVTLQPGMEIDLGGLAKEYAVDRSALLLRQHYDSGVVVNFGGDIFVSGARRNGEPWVIAIDDPRDSGRDSVAQVRLACGGLTTSGDARRFLIKEGVRYSHILNPKSGWPVPDAPRSVTVVSGSCMEAGMLSTFAMLQGRDAALFLKAQKVPYWICWPRSFTETAQAESASH